MPKALPQSSCLCGMDYHLMAMARYCYKMLDKLHRLLRYIPIKDATLSTVGSDKADSKVHIAKISDEYTLFLPKRWENIVTIVAVGHETAIRTVFTTISDTPSLAS